MPRPKLDPYQFAPEIAPLALAELAGLVNELGVSPEQLCADVGISNTDMCAGELVSNRQVARLIRRAIQLTGRSDLGLEVGKRQNISHFGLPGFAMTAMRTFGEAVELGLRYQGQSGGLMDVTSEFDDQFAALLAQSRTSDLVVETFVVEELFASVMVLVRILLGEGYRPHAIELAYPAPPHAARYAEIFNCPIRFGQPRHRALFPRQWFTLPLTSHSPVAAAELRALLEARARRQQAPNTVTAIEHVLQQTGNVAMSVEEVAAALGLSTRTLRRRLTEAGTSFRALSERLRSQEAQHLLRDEGMTVAEASEQLGFSDARAFRRAFKRWVGEVPGAIHAYVGLRPQWFRACAMSDRSSSSVADEPVRSPAPSSPHGSVDDGLRGTQSTWQNWSGAQRAQPSAKCTPRDEDELRRMVQAADSLRVVGAGHSFTPLVPTSGAILSLDHLSGLVNHDAAKQQARIWAGTRLFDAGPLLQGIGQGMPNLGDIDRQSIAGALSTATHGTGISLPCIAAGASALRLVTAQGEVIECGRDHDADVFQAAAVSLGALGVITQVTLQNMPAYRLRERVHVQPLDSLLPEIDSWAQRHRHFELFAFPNSRLAIVKTLDLSNEPITKHAQGGDSDDLALKLGCELTRWAPGLGRGLQAMIGRFIKPTDRVNQWYKIFASPRNVRFNEMEYQVPAAVGAHCIDEVCKAVAASKVNVFFPIEFRFIAADNYWLSPFQGAPGEARCSISVHQYHKQDYRPLFAAAEPVLRRHGGRPHWGKLHTVDTRGLHALYPDLGRFLRLRSELDPQGKFLNPYLRQLFGVPAS
ncbi:D-arabinono-1,4-lactone oxidase [Dyella silvatica]|uniref:D-arabinono-1,4-lactone oxidase n=1 Tax=Dyella silvatica TaxID=2992128 RepID=UPI00224DC3FF|nr:D-arabinono-1,4-lactone oxidase [Dyella silvatica]